MAQEISFQGQKVVAVSGDADCILVAPRHGGRLLQWLVNGREVIRWPSGADWSRINKVRGGNPFLFPFIARHFVNGKLGYWRNAVGQVREMPMHGFARESAFAVVPTGADREVRMRLGATEFTRMLYPFEFQLDLVYRLSNDCLEVLFETTNCGDEPMPYYAGHHFYLAVPRGERAAWEIDLPCKHWGRQRADGSIAFEPAAASRMNLADDALVDRFAVEPAAPAALMRHGGDGREIMIELEAGGDVPWYAVTTWTEDADSDFYCVEPWLGLPNAIHHGYGLRYILPGTTERAVCRLVARGW